MTFIIQNIDAEMNFTVVWVIKNLLLTDPDYFIGNESALIKIVSNSENFLDGVWIVNSLLQKDDENLAMEIVEFFPIEKLVHHEISLTEDTQLTIEFLGQLLSGSNEQT